jgi:hypothetical protein
MAAVPQNLEDWKGNRMRGDPNDLIFKEKPKPRRRVDWPAAAALLARGLAVETVGAQLGCPPSVLRRNLRRSPKFRRSIERAAEEQRLVAQLRFMALGEHAVLHLQQADKLDARILQWLGAQIGLERLGPRLEGDIAARWEVAVGVKDKQGMVAPKPGEPLVYTHAELDAMLAEVRQGREDEVPRDYFPKR